MPHNINEGDECHKGGKTIFSLEFDFNKDGLMDMPKLRNLNYKGLHLEACINNGDKTFTHDPKYFAAVGETWRAAWEGEFVDINMMVGRISLRDKSDALMFAKTTKTRIVPHQ